ncbi:PQ-loop repeat-containing protein 3 [Orussus abietinus]|uniref:PQ-loop repeat-containing protein 3 n=1 Tax=Orussus abietinus TaxID=222816 RepID=UPI0006266024|nr:PQ-loop repeat-containing protein 3 [Orussus abietinus]XP_012287324.1 PQ-loop repeat-containing protein 3 [Orussus abietinus]
MFLQLLADFLSVVTVTLCFVLKIPQILNLLKLKSAVGISLYGLLLELTSYTVMTSYNYTNNYALLSYLEYPVILVQEYVLIFLVLKYLNRVNGKMILAAVAYFVLFACFLLRVIPKVTLTFLAPMCTPISASSKVMQLLTILRAKNADSVSVLTWLISAFTNLTRVYTIWMDSADALLLGNFVISVTLSASIMFTAMYYQRPVKQD